VLSIAKLSAGQEGYLEQAAERVDVAASLGTGAEDYYLDPTEARGRWSGAGAAALGVDGDVEPEQLRRLLAAAHASTGEPLRADGRRVTVAAFDLTFSAPKSVSVLFGVGSEDMGREARAGHDVAVVEALAYLERSAAAVRRGAGGSTVEQIHGFAAARFRHRSSRADDAQLHTHVVIANLGRGADGRWLALDADGSTRTHRRPAGSTRPCSVPSSPSGSGLSGPRSATA
jgi:conjugative relaxase-like TrwC/TraI family protein